jgi:hypothetical protein
MIVSYYSQILLHVSCSRSAKNSSKLDFLLSFIRNFPTNVGKLLSFSNAQTSLALLSLIRNFQEKFAGDDQTIDISFGPFSADPVRDGG